MNLYICNLEVMSTYIVTFEVNDASRLNSLKEGLKSYKVYCPINKYSWAIMTIKTAKEIRDHLAKRLVATDRLFVIRSGIEAAWRNSFGPEYDDWLKKNL